MSASAKKRRRSSLAPFKVKYTDSPGGNTGENDNKENVKENKSLLPNPDNVAMDDSIQLLGRRILRLKTEEADWKDYLKQLDDEVTELENKDSKVVSVDDTSITDEMTSDYLYPMADINNLAKQVKEDHARSLILTLEHERQLHDVKEKSAELETQYENLLNTLHLNKFTDLGCPKAAIQTYLDLPYDAQEDISSPP